MKAHGSDFEGRPRGDVLLRAVSVTQEHLPGKAMAQMTVIGPHLERYPESGTKSTMGVQQGSGWHESPSELSRAQYWTVRIDGPVREPLLGS